MKKCLVFMMVIVLLAVGASVVMAQDKGTPEEAKALVKKAIAYIKEVGKDKAIAEFNDPKGKLDRKSVV